MAVDARAVAGEDDGGGVELVDDGCGLATGTAREGRGLASMRRRANAIGGEVVLSSSAGTAVRLWMPATGSAS